MSDGPFGERWVAFVGQRVIDTLDDMSGPEWLTSAQAADLYRNVRDHCVERLDDLAAALVPPDDAERKDRTR